MNLQTGVGAPPFDAGFVMQAYDIGRPECLTEAHPADCLRNSHQSMRTCNIEACDPRFPYRVTGTSVRFLTLECDQRGSILGSCETLGTDLTGDLDPDDLVLQVLDVRTGSVRPVTEVSPNATEDPLQGGETGGDVGVVVESVGQCRESLDALCSESMPCAEGGVCLEGSCYRNHRTCVTSADCPPSVSCEKFFGPSIVPASPDTDGDTVPDHIDDCVDAANPDQTDGDGDGIGDACDLATCGDGVRTYDEVCEVGDDALCPGSCTSCRCAVCGNVVDEPKAKVQLKTKNAAGQMTASFSIDLGDYTGEPVTIALRDGDTPIIARTTVGGLPPAGKSGKKWLRKSGLKSGVLQVGLQKGGPSSPGTFRVKAKAKRWFPPGAANQPAASTDLTVTVGTQCFRVPVTKKID